MPDNSTGSRKRKRGASKRRVGFGFNAKSREAQRWAKEFVGERITTINTETKLAVRKIVVDSIREGIPPRDAAKQIREMVGLNRPQGLALRRYVQNLSPSLSPAAKAKAGIKLKNKMIRRRAIVIARTEVIDSLSGGVEQAWVQAQQKGLLGSNAKKEWVTTPFGACAICRALNGQSVKITGMFSSEIGPLARPTAHPNCRCGIAPVPGVGGMMRPAGLPPTVTPSMAAALTNGVIGPRHPQRWVPSGGLPSHPTPEGVVRKIRREKMERGAAFDKDDKFLGSYTSDRPNQISTPPEVVSRVEGGTMVHNHPARLDGQSGGGFSPADVDMATWFRLKETRVGSVLDGRAVTYRAKGFDRLSKDASESGPLGERLALDLKKHVEDLDWDITRAFMKGRWGQNPSQSFGWAVKVHAAMKRLAKQHGFDYDANWTGQIGSLSQTGTLDDALRIGGIVL